MSENNSVNSYFIVPVSLVYPLNRDCEVVASAVDIMGNYWYCEQDVGSN